MKPAYRMPTRVLFGEGSFRSLRALPALAHARSVALLTGRRSAEECGTTERLRASLGGLEIHHFSGVPSHPTPDDLRTFAAHLRGVACEAVIAVGGGSVIDVAKGAAYCCRHGHRPFGIPAMSSGGPLSMIAVPTTAGTGAEVTPFATFWDLSSKQKLSLDHPSMFPEDALVDPELTASMPPELTAATGMDALTQACEAYWNVNAGPTSDGHALRAVKLLADGLVRAVRDGQDRSARSDVALGSLSAGLAFSNTRTTACHSLSYPMTIHWGVPHGRAVGITLPEVLALNAAAMDPGPRREAFCEALGVASIDDGPRRLRGLMTECGVATRLSKLGIDSSGIEVIAREGLRYDRMGNNPHAFTLDAARELLRSIL